MTAQFPPFFLVAPSNFSPKSVASTIAWWDAADTSTITATGNDITRLADKINTNDILFTLDGTTTKNVKTGVLTVNGLNCINTTRQVTFTNGATCPGLQTGFPGNKGTIYFVTTIDQTESSGYPWCFIVRTPSTPPGGQQFAFTGDDNYQLYFYGTMYFNTNSLQISRHGIDTHQSYLDGIPHIWKFTWDSTTGICTSSIDGGDPKSVTGFPGIGTTTTNGIELFSSGFSNVQGSSRFSAMTLHNDVIPDGSSTDQQMLAYFQNRYHTPGYTTVTTQVDQAALSGGGYNGPMSIANDGTVFMAYDGANCWRWNTLTKPPQFDNIFGQPHLPAAYQTWGQGNSANAFGYGAPEIAVAPTDSNRVYVIAGSGGSEGLLWNSVDSASHWNEVGASGYHLPYGIHNTRGTGPCMAIDPNNKDHVIISDAAGVIHETLDNGLTWTRTNPGLLPNAVTTAPATGSPLTFASVPALVSSRANYQVAASDLSADPQNPAHAGIIGFTTVSSTTPTTVTCGGFGVGTRGFSPQVNSGDTIIFGYYGCIAFDPSVTTTRSGKTVSKNVYIGWGYGATGVYQSTDGGATYNSIGGPAQVMSIACGQDGVLYICDNVGSFSNNVSSSNINNQILAISNNGSGAFRLTVDNTLNWITGRTVWIQNMTGSGALGNSSQVITVINGTQVDLQGTTFTGSPSGGTINLPFYNAWKFQSGAWTQFVTNMLALDGGWFTCDTDPNNPGAIAFGSASGSIQYSEDNGGNWYGTSGGPGHTDEVAAGNVPWLRSPFAGNHPPNFGNNTFYAIGRVKFDKSNNRRLYMSTGVGLFYANPHDFVGQTTPQINWTQQNRNQQGLIVNDIVRSPSVVDVSGNILYNPLLVAVQDKRGLVLSSPFIEPTYAIGGPGLDNGQACDYAKDRTAYQYVQAFHLWQTINFGADGFTDIGVTPRAGSFHTAMAVGAANNIVVGSDRLFGNNGGAGYTLTATTNPPTWNESLFNGQVWPSAQLGGNGYTIINDPTNINTFYAMVAGSDTSTSVFTATLANGGTGYSANDVLTLAGGNVSPAYIGRITVLTVNGSGVIQTWEISDPGKYSNGSPPSPNSPTGGTGTGAQFNITPTKGCGCYKSTDNGAHFIQQSSNTTYPAALPSTGYNSQLCGVPGQSGHLFYAGGNVFASGKPLARSVDGGVTWSTVGNTQVAWQVSAGATKPGGTYPSIYMTGIANGDSSPGVYRSDSVTTNPAVDPTWLRVCDAPGGNMDISNKIFADLNTWGSFYIAMGGVGYVYGRLV